MQIIIEGDPVGKGRPRLGKYGTYTPQKTRDYEEYVYLCFIKQNRNVKPFVNPVKVNICACFEPKGLNKANNLQAIKEHLPMTKKPDIDNVAKIILDSLNGLAYLDDNQVAELTITKEYHVVSKVIVKIEEI